MRSARWLLLGALAIAAAVGMATSVQADHPAQRVLLVVIDGPRHDLAFDENGPLAPLYELENATVGEQMWTAGRAQTMPGHAALLTGRPQPIANDGSQPAHGELLWDSLAEDRGWGEEEMRWLYQKPKLASLASEHTGGGLVDEQPPDEAMLDALEANTSDPDARVIAASFAHPDTTGHEGDWPAHRASLARIAMGLAPLVEAQAGPATLVLVTADHARYCQQPEDHGSPGPLEPVDDCDAHIPLLATGWHIRDGARTATCLTQADLGVLVARALDTELAGATGRFPQALVDASDTEDREDCPPDRGGLPSPVPGAGPPATVLALVLASGVAAGLFARAHRAS